MIEKDLKDFLKLFKEFNKLARFVSRIRFSSGIDYFSTDLLICRKERVSYEKMSIAIGRLIVRIKNQNNDKYNRIAFTMLSTLFSSIYCHHNDHNNILFGEYQKLSMRYRNDERAELHIANAVGLVDVIEASDLERRNKFVYFLLTF